MTPFFRSMTLSLLLPAAIWAQPVPTPTPAGQSETLTTTPDSTGPRSTDARAEQIPSSSTNLANALSLSLNEAVETAARRNLGVDIERFDYRSTGHRARATYGAFDFFTQATVETSETERAVASSIDASLADRTFANIGVTQLLPTGGTYSVGFNNSRSGSNSPFVDVNPAYQSNLFFDFSQPLLRDFGVDIARRNVNIARNNLGISEGAFRNALILTTLAVEQAYYELIYARQELEVRRQSATLARDQERITQIRIDVGASAPLDILQPRVAIATREEEVILAEARISAAEDRLRQLMNLPPEEWDRPIVPTETLDYERVTVDTVTAVERAMQLRPEIQQARLGTENSRIDLNYLRNQVLPRLNLELGYGTAGLAGTQFGPDPITGEPIVVNRTGINRAFDQVFGNDFPSWSVGFSVGLPIFNIGARANARSAEMNLESSRIGEDQLRQDIAVQVRQAIRDIETSDRRIAATRTAREAAGSNLEAERKRFENGMTTNFNVLLIQQDLSDARSREILAQVAYLQSIANYHRAVGDILEIRGIALQTPEEFSLPRSKWEDKGWLRYDNYSKRSDSRYDLGTN